MLCMVGPSTFHHMISLTSCLACCRVGQLVERTAGSVGWGRAGWLGAYTGTQWLARDQRALVAARGAAKPFEQGIKVLGLLLTGSTGQHMASRNGLA